ncbi:MAG: hypothetical protein R2824_27325 [Saprospiraceae bacterium]
MQYKNDDKILLILDVDETLVFATEEVLEREADYSTLLKDVYDT